VLRDLGSSNGTTVDGRPLAPRQRCVLNAGSQLCFGGEAEVWTVADLTPPAVCAVLLGPQEYHWGNQTLLVLPSQERPEANIWNEAERCSVETDERQREPECGELIQLPSGWWRLLLPELSGVWRVSRVTA
jgi:hypothetical protein